MKAAYKRVVIFIISSQFINKAGESLYDLAMPLLVLHVTGSAFLMGTMYALGFVAEFLVGFFGGTIVDRVNRKKLLLTVSLLLAVFMLIIPVSQNLDVFNIIILLFVTFFIDLLISLYRTADISIIPQLVEKIRLPQATGYMQTSMSTAEAIGPALAGFLIGALGLFQSLWINVFVFIFLGLTILFIKNISVSAEKKHLHPSEIWKSSMSGLQYTLDNKLFKLILIWSMFINLGLSGAVLMVIFHLTEVLHLSEQQIGLVMTAGAIGGIVCGLIVSKLQSIISSGKLLLISSNIMALALISMASFTNWAILSFVFGMLMGSTALNSRMIHLLFQSTVPSNMLGRVISASRLITTLLAPASVFLAGLIAQNYGSVFVFWGSAGIILMTTAVGFITQLNTATWAIKEKSIKN